MIKKKREKDSAQKELDEKESKIKVRTRKKGRKKKGRKITFYRMKSGGRASVKKQKRPL